MRRVVVTGMGAITPVGLDVPTTWDALIAGTSGIDRVTLFETSDLDVRIAGEVKGFDPTNYLDRKEARRMDLFIHYGLAAALQAWRESGLEITPHNAERVGINYGSGIGGLPLIEAQHNELTERGPRRLSPFFIPGSIINMTAGLLSMMKMVEGT